MKRRRLLRKLNNKGGALVLVIVAIALVTILASVLMSISLINFQMKVVEKEAKEVFYTTEEVLDAIHAGLEVVISDATDAAYITAMQTYKLDALTEQYRIAQFRTDYMGKVMDALKHPDPSKGSNFYYIGGVDEGEVRNADGLYDNGLASFLTASMASDLESGKLTVTCNLVSGGNGMLYTTKGLILKGLTISYTDTNGYYSRIETDICIGYPDIELNESTVIPNVFDCSLIAHERLVFESAPSTSVTGNVYAGTGGVVAKNGSLVTISDPDYMVTKGEVQVEATAEVVLNGDNFWTKGIAVDGSGKLSSNGVLYVQDDLTITGKGSHVVLSGDYLGYGDGDGLVSEISGNSSAIILNCKNATLNMNGLNTLMLCGNAYINGNKITYLAANPEGEPVTTGNAEQIMLGTSVAMKTDQIAFLAPTECLGTLDGELMVGKNPMNAAEYELWWNTYATQVGYKKLDEDVMTRVVGSELSTYGLNTSSFQRIFRTVGGETLCYVYLRFDSAEQADRYYRDYMNVAWERMAGYLERFHNNVIYDGLTGTQLTRGNVLTYSTTYGYVPPIGGTINESMDSDVKADLDAKKSSYSKTYRALCSKMTNNYNGLNEAELAKDVYENVVLQPAVEGLATTQVYELNDDYAIVVDNNDVGDAAYVVGSGASGEERKKCRLLIASGDVEVVGNYAGLIIAGGEIIVKDYTGASITSDKETVTKLLQFQPPELGGYSVIESYFKDGSRYILKGNTLEDSAYVNLEKVISYMNWTKK